MDPVEVGGRRMFHMAGRTGTISWAEAYGLKTERNVYYLTFEFSVDQVKPKQRRKIIDSVLATVEIDE